MHLLKQMCMHGVLVFHERFASLRCPPCEFCVKTKPLFKFCIFNFYYFLFYCVFISSFNVCHACVWLASGNATTHTFWAPPGGLKYCITYFYALPYIMYHYKPSNGRHKAGCAYTRGMWQQYQGIRTLRCWRSINAFA